jgi:hypothetical protein
VTQEILTRLNSDSEYYGDFGKTFLSNSDIGTLLKDPSSYGKDKEKTVPMVQGSYFHTAMLEPQKMVDFLICDVTSRNTNKYKEMCEAMGADIILLSKEVEELDSMVESVKGRMDFFDMIYEDGNSREHARQEIPYTDFPLDSITLYACWDQEHWVIMLPSEY